MRIIEPRTPLLFEITKKHVELADKHRGQPCFCVVAQALQEVPDAVAAVVHPYITNLMTGTGNVRRYLTPTVLREALDNWDKGNDWQLPSGEYFLEPVYNSKKVSVMRQEYKDRKSRGEFKGRKRNKCPLRKKPTSPRTIANFAKMREERALFED